MKKVILSSLFACSILCAKSQDFGQVIAGSVSDANKYLGEYLKPFGEGEIYNLSRGWYSTAKVHKKLGFDISISGQFAVVPSSKETFVFNNSDYTSFKLKNTAITSATLPTFMGPAPSSQQVITATASATVNGQTKNVTADFSAPNGIGDDFKKNVSFVPLASPLPVLQVGVGLIKHTELKVRYFPKTAFSDVELGVFGVAVQHEFSNYLPFIKKAPFLHLSAIAGYTKIDANYKPVFGSGSPVQNKKNGVAANNSISNYGISAFTLQGIVSAKFAFLEIYTAVGYSNGKSNIDLKGDYEITYQTNTIPSTVTTTAKDPLAISYTASSVSNTWGIRFNLFFLKLHADYTFAQYNGLGVGAAFSFR